MIGGRNKQSVIYFNVLKNYHIKEELFIIVATLWQQL